MSTNCHYRLRVLCGRAWDSATLAESVFGGPMKNLLLWVAIAFSCLISPAYAEDAAGRWIGAIDNHLLAFVSFEKDANGMYRGTFSSHEQPLTKPDANAISSSSLTAVTATSDKLRFAVPAVGGATFAGSWDNRIKRWVGTFQWGEGGYKSQLTLRRTTAITLADAVKPRIYANVAEEQAEMAALIDAYVQDGRFNGIVLVKRGEQVLIDQGFGMADIERGVLNTPATRFRIASITKSFTATAVLMLQDQGKLRIDDTISKYLSNAPKSWDGISLRHLLRHTSGLGDYNPAIEKNFSKEFSPAQLISVIRKQRPTTKPGEAYQYSNAGYALLGMVVEQASGQAYGDFLRDNIFVPLGMDATSYNPVFDTAKEAQGYMMGDPSPVVAPYRALSNTYASGGIVSTTHDLVKWQRALFAGKLISAEALAQMIAEGQGVVVSLPDGRPAYSHSGHLFGYVSDASYQPDDQLSVIVLGNFDNSSPVWISKALTTIAHGVPADVVPVPRAIALSQEQLSQYAGTYRLAIGVNLRISVEGDHLLIQAPGRDNVAAWPESETLFFSRTTEAKLEFVREKSGELSIILHQAGQRLAGVRK